MIRETRPFWIGLLWVIVCAAGFLLKERVGTSGSGPAIQYWPWWVWSIMGLPGFFLLCAGIKPESFFGTLGMIILKLLTWIRRNSK